MTELELVFDAAAHSTDAIQRAAYKFMSRFSLELKRDGDEYRCVLHLPDETAEVDRSLIADFRNEVLDQVLRERIRAETEGVRNLVLSLAFSNTSLTST